MALEGSAGKRDPAAQRGTTRWGGKLFVVTLLVVLVFFWWLLIYSGGVELHHG